MNSYRYKNKAGRINHIILFYLSSGLLLCLLILLFNLQCFLVPVYASADVTNQKSGDQIGTYASLDTPPFNQGAGYQAGAYDLMAVHPTTYNWQGQSRFISSPVISLKWVFPTSYGAGSAPVIGADDTIYYGADKLYAINPDGTVKWQNSELDYIRFYSPVISANGTLYATGEGRTTLYAFDPNGKKIMEFQADGTSYFTASPAIGSDGTIYIGSWDNKLYAFQPDGTKKWIFMTNGQICGTPAIGTDGTIYVGSWDGKLYAINEDGTEKWDYATGNSLQSSPVIGPDGTIYTGTVSDNNFYAINPHGGLKWKYQTRSGVSCYGTAVSRDGTIYFAASDGYIYALSSDGKKLWSFLTKDGYPPNLPVIDNNGTILCSSHYDNRVYAINPDGSKKWSYVVDDVWTTPVIGSDGILYFRTYDGNLYALGNSVGELNLSIVQSDISEGIGKLVIDVTRKNGKDGTVTVDYSTIQGSAVEGQDFTPVTGTLTFTSGESIKELEIPIIDDQIYEGDEFFTIALTNPTGGAILGKNHSIILDIKDNEKGSPKDLPFGQGLGYQKGAYQSNGEQPTAYNWTRQSRFFGSKTGALNWSFATQGEIIASPAIGSDGSIYISSGDNKLYSIKQNGDINWAFNFNSCDSGWSNSPIIGKDGVIYVQKSMNFYAINPDGAIRWMLSTAGFGHTASPVLTEDGKIYLCTENNLLIINPNGTVYRDDQITGSYYPLGNPPAIAANGTLYMFKSGCLAAVGPDGKDKWIFRPLNQDSINSPASIGMDGTIYVGSTVGFYGTQGYLYALDSDGREKWEFQTAGVIQNMSAIASESTIYISCNNGNLYAINNDGTEKWHVNIGDTISTPLVSADGIVYIGCKDGNLYAINKAGSILWNFSTGGSIYSSPALGANGVVYVGSSDGNLYAVGCDAGEINLGASTYTISENVGTISIPVIRTGGNDSSATVDYETKDLTAIAGKDYNNLKGTLTFTRGEESQILTIPIIDNSTPEYNKEFTIILNNPSGALVGNIDNASIIIENDDSGTLISSSQGPGYQNGAYQTGASNPYGFNWSRQSKYTVNGTTCTMFKCSNTGISSSTAIALGGTLHVSSWDGTLYALNSDGTQKWNFPMGSKSTSTPVIGADGTIYAGAEGNMGESFFYAIDAYGTKKWALKSRAGTPAISNDYTIYFASNNILLAVDRYGNKKWQYTGNDLYGNPVIGIDGTIYVGCRDYNLYAFNPDGSKKWEFSTGTDIGSAPAIGDDGTIYIGSMDGKLSAVNPTGAKKWDYMTQGAIEMSPAVSTDGTIYIGSLGTFYAFNSDGSNKWQLPISTDDSSPVIGADGTVYVKSRDSKLIAINPNGTIKQEITGGWPVVCTPGTSPVIGSDNALYFGTDNGFIYRIGGEKILSAGQFQFNNNCRVPWTNSSARIYIARVGGANGTVSVDYCTGDGYKDSDNSTGGTGSTGTDIAKSGVDYIASSGSLQFSEGEYLKYIEVKLLRDNYIPFGLRTFNIQLKNATGGATIGNANVGYITVDYGTLDRTVVVIPQTIQKPSSDISLPIYLNNAVGAKNIQFDLNFDPAIVIIKGVSKGVILAGQLSYDLSKSAEGKISISLDGDDTVKESGILCWVVLDIGDVNPQSTEVILNHLLIKDTLGNDYEAYPGSNKSVNILNGQIYIQKEVKDECFIATAAYGSKFIFPVTLLRSFRDRFLLSNRPGQIFVRLYYHYSPPIAQYIAQNNYLRAIVRCVLVPVVISVYILFHPWIAVLLLFIILALVARKLPMWIYSK